MDDNAIYLMLFEICKIQSTEQTDDKSPGTQSHLLGPVPAQSPQGSMILVATDNNMANAYVNKQEGRDLVL